MKEHTFSVSPQLDATLQSIDTPTFSLKYTLQLVSAEYPSGVPLHCPFLVFSFCFGVHFGGRQATPDPASTLCSTADVSRQERRPHNGAMAIPNLLRHWTGAGAQPCLSDFGRKLCGVGADSDLCVGSHSERGWGQFAFRV